MDLPAHHSGRTLVSAPLVARSDGYFAPELIGRKISPKSDVYSFGVVRFSSNNIILKLRLIFHLEFRLCWKHSLARRLMTKTGQIQNW